MSKAIREHLRELVAVVALFVVGLATTAVIFSEQGAHMPGWVPVLGSDRFELKGEFSTAQAVTPGQGQTVNIAGIRVGDISEVEVDEGTAVVTMEIDDSYTELIHRDASMLLRPRTGLQDMTIEVDPGTRGEPVADGTTIPVAQTEPNVQPDQILASLDGDTQAYLQLLLDAGARGLGGERQGRRLSAGLRRFEPLGRDLAKINGALAERRENIRRAITNFRLVSEELGDRDTQLAEFVDSSNAVLDSFANQEASIRAALREAPGALSATRGALASSDRLASELGPASEALIPSARALGPALRETRPFFRQTTPAIRNQIRPFSRQVQKPIRHLAQASDPLQKTTAGLERGFGDLNRLTNALAYNPPGAEEGYAFWLAWANHNTNAIFLTQDAAGPLRHGLVMFSCLSASIAEAIAEIRPPLKTQLQISNVPTSQEIDTVGGCG